VRFVGALNDRQQEGAVPRAARDQQTPQALGALHRAAIEKWWPIIKAANLKAD
jgi:hypothetical protein